MCRSRVVADIAIAGFTLSIHSTDTSLAFDNTKLRLKEYKKLIKSDSPAIGFATEDGKTIAHIIHEARANMKP